jgi:hypothetical protein
MITKFKFKFTYKDGSTRDFTDVTGYQRLDDKMFFIQYKETQESKGLVRKTLTEWVDITNVEKIESEQVLTYESKQEMMKADMQKS